MFIHVLYSSINPAYDSGMGCKKNKYIVMYVDYYTEYENEK